MINERENERRVWRRQEEQEEKGPRQVPLKSRWRKERVWDIAVPELYTTGTLDRTVSVNFNFLSLRPVFQVVTLPMTPRQKRNKARNRKYRKTSTSPRLPSSRRSHNRYVATWLCHMPLRPNPAIGTASMIPLCFPRPKFLANVVTAARYIQLVAVPIATNATTITQGGHPSPPASGSGPLLYAKAARR